MTCFKEKSCSKCGNMFMQDSLFCRRCGAKRGSSQSSRGLHSDEAAQQIFEALDRDGDGAISRQDLQEALLSDDVGPQALCALGSGTAMEAAKARSAHSEALQAERQRRLEDFRRACQRRVATRGRLEATSGDPAAAGYPASTKASASAVADALTASAVPQMPQPTVQFLDPTRGIWAASRTPPAGGLQALHQYLVESREKALKSLAASGTSVPEPPVLEDTFESNETKHPAAQEGGSCGGTLSTAAEQFTDVLQESMRRRVTIAAEELPSPPSDKEATSPLPLEEPPSPLAEKEATPLPLEEPVDQGEPAATEVAEVAKVEAATVSEGKTSAAKVARAEGDRPSRYTSGLLSLMVRAYAKRGRQAPRLCACLAVPQGPPPSIGNDGNLSQSPAWEAFIQKVSSPERHARNCEFAQGGLSKLQRQVLLLIQAAKEQ
eukprot:TRINITY_DN88123_c0_g1_i1.p1 TRINITY_DN88123_c0_g1~~TRINITY_DN88123_c0_g1_i1.p1  ORF type:complete len:436 (+),score=101.03 TRINITY_DN88123_c0_g1_i1:190-1497(+)